MGTRKMKSRRRYISYMFYICLCFLACRSSGQRPEAFFERGLINLDHLDHLCEDVVIEGDTVTIVHIYANHPDYAWVEAEGEGIACVDDVARAAVVYLRYYQLSREPSVLPRIRGLLDFVIFMQAEDGEFYNFITPDLEINRTGRTSIKSFNFWAARAYWALGYGYSVLRSIDPVYAQRLQNLFLMCKKPIEQLLIRYGKFTTEGNREYPIWLVNDSGSDATSELLLGLGYYLESERDDELEVYALKLAEGMMAMQMGEGDVYPGAFISWRGLWHAYANAQTQALSRLGKVLKKKSLIRSAEEEAQAFYSRIVKDGFIHAVRLDDENRVDRLPQIAYDVRPVVVGLIELERATGHEEYGEWAGLAAAWFLGRNPAGRVMFDVTTGRCYDGINDSTSINLNSGAESTIEALASLLEVASHPSAYASMMHWVGQSTFEKSRTQQP